MEAIRGTRSKFQILFDLFLHKYDGCTQVSKQQMISDNFITTLILNSLGFKMGNQSSRQENETVATSFSEESEVPTSFCNINAPADTEVSDSMFLLYSVEVHMGKIKTDSAESSSNGCRN